MIQEGDVLLVEIQKTINTGPGEDFYMLQTLEGERYLLDAKPYIKYDLKIGTTIEVVVDRINCSGKVFLEPRHPFYSIGNHYPFRIIGESLNERNTGRSLFVADCFGNEIMVDVDEPFADDLIQNNEIKLEVIAIHKGIPILQIRGNVTSDRFKLHDTETFDVKGIKNINEELFFQLEDRLGKQHLLPCNDYKNYNIKPGQQIRCEITRIRAGGHVTLEPEHPHLRLHDTVELTLQGLNEDKEILGSRHELYWLTDALEQRYYMSVRFIKNPIWGLVLQCSVERFKKGRVLVAPLHTETRK